MGAAKKKNYMCVSTYKCLGTANLEDSVIFVARCWHLLMNSIWCPSCRCCRVPRPLGPRCLGRLPSADGMGCPTVSISSASSELFVKGRNRSVHRALDASQGCVGTQGPEISADRQSCLTKGPDSPPCSQGHPLVTFNSPGPMD